MSTTDLVSTALRSSTMLVAGQLRAVLDAPDTTSRVAETVKQRLGRIEEARSFLDDRTFRIAFVGQVGAGKSALISVLAELLVEGHPEDKKSLKASSVLAIGSGRTTVCEVRIRAATEAERGRLGLLIDPCSVEEMQQIIGDFARDEWRRHRDTTLRLDDEADKNPTPKEIQRVIRNMTGTKEKYRTVVVDGKRKEEELDPLVDLVKGHDSPGSFANYMIERAGLLSRHDRDWWWDQGEEALSNLKERFDDVNNGQTPTAMLPRTITLVVPDPLPGCPLELELELVDTRGFDGNLEGRPDIQSVLKDPRCLVVSCTSFKDAPSEGLKSLLASISKDAVLRPALGRLLLVLMDHDDSEQANGAEGSRARGQMIKCREAGRILEGLGHGALAGDETLIAHDTIRDPREELVARLGDRIQAIRSVVRDTLEREVRDASNFLEHITDQRMELARADVDRQLALTLHANRPMGAPLRDPLQGLYDAIRWARYASQVQASNRRNGSYWALDAYTAVRSGAATAATAWVSELVTAVRTRFKALEADPELQEISSHIRLRRDQFEEGLVELVDEYADAVQQEVSTLLYPDYAVWGRCKGEWGQGPGFKDRVIRDLQDWSRQQPGLQAHGRAEPTEVIPVALIEAE